LLRGPEASRSERAAKVAEIVRIAAAICVPMRGSSQPQHPVVPDGHLLQREAQ
jgi:hypothetical protein